MPTNILLEVSRAAGETTIRPGDPIKHRDFVGPMPTLIFPNSPGRPARVLMGVVGDSRLQLQKPVPVDVSTDAGSVIAYFGEVEEFGYGPNLSAAMDDLSKALAQLFLSLVEREADLGQPMADALERLRHYFKLRERR